VVERHPRLDARLQAGVDDAAVVVQPAAVGGVGAGRLDPRPREGEAVGAEAQCANERDVLAEAAVGVRGDIRGGAVLDRGAAVAVPAVGERVPDGGALAVRRGRTLDLERGGGHAPGEVRPEVRQVGGRRAVHGTLRIFTTSTAPSTVTTAAKR